MRLFYYYIYIIVVLDCLSKYEICILLYDNHGNRNIDKFIQINYISI